MSFKDYLRDFPTTPYRIIVSTVGFIAVVVVGVGFRKEIPEGVLWFLLGWSASDVVQFAAKRITFKPEQVNTLTEENKSDHRKLAED